MEVVSLLLRAAALSGGIIVVFAALFAREREEKLVQETLEVWWVHLDDAAARAIRAHTRLEAIAAVHTAQYLDRIFGHGVRSTRAVAAAFAYAAAAVTTVIVITLPASWQCYRGCGVLMLKHGVAIATMLTLGIIAALKPRVSIGAAMLAVIAFVTCVRLTDKNTDIFTLIAIVAVGAALILTWVAITGKTLRWLGRSENVGVRVAVALVHLAAAPLFVIGPPIIGALLVRRNEGEGMAWTVGLLAGCALLFAALASLSFVAAIVINFSHRMLWRSVDRPLYALQRHNLLVMHRKKLIALGVALVAAAFPGINSLVSQLPW